jgi:alpha-galactosidase
VLGAHIGPTPYHTTGRSQLLDFRAGVALPLHLGIELDVRKIDAKQRSQLLQWVDLYKSLRERAHVGQVWLGDCGDHIVWQAHGQSDNLIVFVTRTAPTAARHSPSLILPMLDRKTQYGIRRLDPVCDAVANAGVDSTLHKGLRQGQTVEAHGAWLALSGLPLPRMAGESVHIFEVKKA